MEHKRISKRSTKSGQKQHNKSIVLAGRKRMPAFNPRIVHFVDTVALGQGSLRVLLFSLHGYIIPPMLHAVLSGAGGSKLLKVN
jgi:hypothetical protein